MNAPFLPELRHSRRRAIEVEFLTERYHRAFDEEAATLAALAALAGATELAAAVDKLRLLLERHERLQEQRLFPAYEHGASLDAALFEAWMSDCAAISDATAALRDVCRASSQTRLCARTLHFAFEVDSHLVDELEVFAEWAGRA